MKMGASMRKTMAWAFAIMAVIAVTLGVSSALSTQAYADEPDTLANTYLVKDYQFADSLDDAAHETFTFTFTPVSQNNIAYADATTAMPAEYTYSITYNGASAEHPWTTSVQGDYGTAVDTGNYHKTKFSAENFIPAVGTTAGTNFTHAGEYVYNVVESGNTHDGLTYSKATYQIHVYVENTGTEAAPTLTITNVGIYRTHSETAALDPAVKVDGATTGADSFIFKNVYTEKHQLTISKTVAETAGSPANVADLTKQFSYTMTLQLPDSDLSLVGTKVTFVKNDAAGTTYESTVFDNAGKATVTFALCHGESISLRMTETDDSKLPTGTKYEFTETGVTNYTPKADLYTTSDTVDTTVTGSEGNNLNIGDNEADGNAYTIVSNNDKTKAAVTNTYKAVTPTGIIINNLPYILIVGAAVAGLIAFVVTRRRRNATKIVG